MSYIKLGFAIILTTLCSFCFLYFIDDSMMDLMFCEVDRTIYYYFICSYLFTFIVVFLARKDYEDISRNDN